MNYAIAFISFFSFISTLGLNAIVVREVTKHKTLHDKIIGTAFYLKLYGGVLAFVLGSLLIYFIKPEDNVTQLIVILLLFGYVSQSIDVIDYLFQAKVLSKYTVYARNMAFVLSSMLKVYFILNEYDVVYFAFAILIDVVLASVFIFFIYTKLGFNVMVWKFDSSVAIQLLKDSWPLMLSAFFITIYMKIDQVMIESFLDMRSVGLYSVAVRLSEAWYFIPAIIVSTVMPYFVKLRDTNQELYIFRLKQIFTLMFWMSICIGVFITLFGEQMIILLFGETYKDAYIALSLNIWAGIFISIGVASTLWMITENLQIYQLVGTLIGVVLNVVGNYILIPLYGISGAAIATLLTQGLGLWIVPLFFKPIREFTIMSFKSILPVYLIKEKK